MNKILIAAALIAGLGGLVAASAAHADAFNGEAQRSIEYFHNGRSAGPAFDALAADPNAYAMTAPAGTGIDAESDYSTKSHGRP